MLVSIIILSVLLSGSIFFNINLLRKIEANEDYIEDLENSNTDFYTFFNELKTQVGKSNSHMKQIDRLGSFESDDETGFVFKELKDIVEKINQRF
jgi:peptidoglycan hydrolase CwlO-like protein